MWPTAAPKDTDVGDCRINKKVAKDPHSFCGPAAIKVTNHFFLISTRNFQIQDVHKLSKNYSEIKLYEEVKM
jgi:hypothetical protein